MSLRKFQAETALVPGNLLSLTGNQTGFCNIYNRLKEVNTGSGAEKYGYNPSNQRIWKQRRDGTEEFNFYGFQGELTGTYKLEFRAGAVTQFVELHTNIYLQGKLIHAKNPPFAANVSQGEPVILDRLGSVRAAGAAPSQLLTFYPYGEERTTSANEAYKYATYFRDQDTGLDYARNRYYSSTWGQFLTPDPYQASAGPADPGSWNRYPYVQGDPVNYYDPDGLNPIGFCTGMTSAGVSTATAALCTMMTQPRPSIGDLYNGSGLGLGLPQPSAGSGANFGAVSPTLAAGETAHVLGVVVPGYLLGAFKNNPVLIQAALPAGAVSATITYGQQQQTSSIVSALTALPQMFWEGWAQLLLNEDSAGALKVLASLSATLPGPLLGVLSGALPEGAILFGHGVRHLVGTGLAQRSVESAIVTEISGMANISGHFWGRVVVAGQVITYRAYPLPNGTISVGTYYLPRATEVVRWIPRP